MSENLVRVMEKENEEYIERIITTKRFLNKIFDESLNGKPKLAITLGSGLGKLAEDDDMVKKAVVHYSKIPNFPQSNVEGHAGELILAEFKGKPVILMCGRTHFYEYNGIPGINTTQAMREITFPIRVLKAIGVDTLLMSNSAGGLNPNIMPPQLMLCKSFMDRTNASPLMGLNIDLLGPRFPPMGGDECNEELAGYLKEAAKDLGIDLLAGVYAMLPGPRYEFSGECMILKNSGVDAVGMSMVPDVVVSLHGYNSQKEYDEAIKVVKEKGTKIPDGADYTMARRIKVATVSCGSM